MSGFQELLCPPAQMYHKYNTVLRSKSGNPFLVKLCGELCMGNTFATTIQ